MKEKIKKIISIILILISTTIFSISLYIKNVFSNAKFEQLLYSLKFAEGTSEDVLIDGIKYCLPIALILTLVLSIPNFIKYKNYTYIRIKLKKVKKYFKVRILPICSAFVYSGIVFIGLILYSLESIGTFEYIKNQNTKSTIFEDYYINPNDVKLEFPDKKKNLIYVYLESIETGYNEVIIDNEEVNLIPNLEKIANDNVYFSNEEYLGGAYQIYGASWTIAAIIAQTSGVPLKLNIDGNSYNYNSFMPGIISLGDILQKEGYNQSFMIGSLSSFAGKDIYLNEHGNYEILDLEWAYKNKKISEDYYEFWGYEDKKLFEFAKEELKQLASKEEPFNFTMLTVDTHAIDGYLDKACPKKYSYSYANAISCSDSMIYDFINWIKKQDFYKNTTIVLTGDHITMQNDITDYLTNENRIIYNTFINAESEAGNSKNRQFNSFDMFPTTLSALGVKIEGERLGLGTNLFSKKQTLSEELGIDLLTEELEKSSNYYNKYFLQATYYEMLKEDSQKEKE